VVSESAQPVEGAKPPPRVALLASYLSDEYEWSIVKGARRAVEGRGGTVTCFAGGSLSDPNLERRARTFVHELVDRSRFDAVLCISSCVSQHLPAAEGAAWLGRFRLPLLSIGTLPGIPGVSISDSEGVLQLMRHLIAQHRHRRIAFIEGTATNPEACARRAAYVHALEEHELELDERLILPGDFTRDSGASAVHELFDARQVPVADIDAIVASNDYMAFGAIDELSRRRITVPDQVAVVGFDDMALSRIHDPPLTTVRQPLELLGSEGAGLLLDLLDGSPPQPVGTLGTELLLRRSCGCVPTDIPPPPDGAVGLDRASADMLNGLLAEIDGQRGAFARTLEPLLRRLAAGNARKLEENRRLADDLATRLRLSGDDLVHDRLHRLARSLELRMFGPQALLSQALAVGLAELGLDACAVSELTATPGQLKRAFGFDAHTSQPQMLSFESSALVPEALHAALSGSSVVLPLKYGEEPLGIAVLPLAERDGLFYETLGEVLGIVLKGLEVRRRAEAR
jgi:DNA-binding LacI/PurR family transcriptional regulator